MQTNMTVNRGSLVAVVATVLAVTSMQFSAIGAQGPLNCSLHVKFINSAPGAPLPDLIELEVSRQRVLRNQGDCAMAFCRPCGALDVITHRLPPLKRWAIIGCPCGTNAGFTLQTAPAVTGTFTNLSGATSPFTNLISGGQQFYRLAAP